jgi:hypothetical protein
MDQAWVDCHSSFDFGSTNWVVKMFELRATNYHHQRQGLVEKLVW